MPVELHYSHRTWQNMAKTDKDKEREVHIRVLTRTATSLLSEKFLVYIKSKRSYVYLSYFVFICFSVVFVKYECSPSFPATELEMSLEPFQ